MGSRASAGTHSGSSAAGRHSGARSRLLNDSHRKRPSSSTSTICARERACDRRTRRRLTDHHGIFRSVVDILNAPRSRETRVVRIATRTPRRRTTHATRRDAVELHQERIRAEKLRLVNRGSVRAAVARTLAGDVAGCVHSSGDGDSARNGGRVQQPLLCQRIKAVGALSVVSKPHRVKVCGRTLLPLHAQHRGPRRQSTATTTTVLNTGYARNDAAARASASDRPRVSSGCQAPLHHRCGTAKIAHKKHGTPRSSEFQAAPVSVTTNTAQIRHVASRGPGPSFTAAVRPAQAAQRSRSGSGNHCAPPSGNAFLHFCKASAASL